MIDTCSLCFPPALQNFSGGSIYLCSKLPQQASSLMGFGCLHNAGHLRTLTTRVAHVLPVSDDGGSTAEIVRVLGGPAVGDIRSRCLRLADDSNEEVGGTRLQQSFSARSSPYTHLLPPHMRFKLLCSADDLQKYDGCSVTNVSLSLVMEGLLIMLSSTN